MESECDDDVADRMEIFFASDVCFSERVCFSKKKTSSTTLEFFSCLYLSIRSGQF